MYRLKHDEPKPGDKCRLFSLMYTDNVTRDDHSRATHILMPYCTCHVCLTDEKINHKCCRARNRTENSNKSSNSRDVAQLRERHERNGCAPYDRNSLTGVCPNDEYQCISVCSTVKPTLVVDSMVIRAVDEEIKKHQYNKIENRLNKDALRRFKFQASRGSDAL